MSAEVRCRSCDGTELSVVLDLGQTPLANSLVSPGASLQDEERFPLVLAYCPGCSLVQITHSVPPEKMFSDYPYFSSFSDAMVAHAGRCVSSLIPRFGLSKDSLVVEIASNDGYLLQHYVAAGVPVLGIEPARNVAEVAVEKRKIPTLVEFFGRDLARRLVAEGRRADVIHANNVLAHVPDLNGVIGGFAELLSPRGVVVIEAPYVRDMIEKVEFDTIYHEHLSYFSVSALRALFDRHGLQLVDVERLGIHGGSLRLFVGRKGALPVAASVEAILAEEHALGMTAAPYYASFARSVETLRVELTAMLRDLKEKGARIAAYGASAKGSTLLNTFRVGVETIDFAADRSTYKQGKLMPGVRIPIVDPEALRRSMPDFTLLLTWNFVDEVLAQQQAYRDAGGKFIVPVPHPHIV